MNTLNSFHAFTACPWIRLVDHSVYDRPQITEIKRQRLENEEEIERLKVMFLGVEKSWDINNSNNKGAAIESCRDEFIG